MTPDPRYPPVSKPARVFGPPPASSRPPVPPSRDRRRHEALRAQSPQWLVDDSAAWPMEMPTAPRFLIHQARFHIGDVLWLTPLLRAVHENFPPAEITVVGPPVAHQVLAGNHHVSKLIAYPEGGAEREQNQALEALDGAGQDVALLAFARWPESTWLARELARRGTAVRVNLEYFDDDYNSEVIAPWATHEGWFHWSVLPSPEMMLHALDPFFAPGTTRHHADRRVEFHVSTTARALARESLVRLGLEGKAFVVLAPGGYSSDRWPAENFADLAAWLADDLGVRVLIEGSPQERDLLHEVYRGACRHVSSAARPWIHLATDPLDEFAAILEQAWLLVSNNSAPIHLAEAMGTPSLYFAQREKLVHSHPVGPSWALFDDALDTVARITVAQAAAAIEEISRLRQSKES